MRKWSVYKSKGTFYLTPLILFKCIILERTRHGEIYIFKPADSCAAVMWFHNLKLNSHESSQAGGTSVAACLDSVVLRAEQSRSEIRPWRFTCSVGLWPPSSLPHCRPVLITCVIVPTKQYTVDTSRPVQRHFENSGPLYFTY